MIENLLIGNFIVVCILIKIKTKTKIEVKEEKVFIDTDLVLVDQYQNALEENVRLVSIVNKHKGFNGVFLDNLGIEYTLFLNVMKLGKKETFKNIPTNELKEKIESLILENKKIYDEFYDYLKTN